MSIKNFSDVIELRLIWLTWYFTSYDIFMSTLFSFKFFFFSPTNILKFYNL